MKIPDKQGQFQQIAYNHLSDIGFGYFINLQKKCTTKVYSFLLNDAILVDPLRSIR